MSSTDLPGSPEDAALEQALASSRAMVNAPESTILRAVSLFQARVPAPAAEARPSLRSIATKIFDSLSVAPLALGLRSDRQSSRQLLFSADGRDIDLRITGIPPEGAVRFTVAGQVFGPDAAGQAELKAVGYHAKQAWTEWSEFRFADVPPGPCTLLLTGADWQIELPAFELSADT
jgi:hypothetical protein